MTSVVDPSQLIYNFNVVLKPGHSFVSHISLVARLTGTNDFFLSTPSQSAGFEFSCSQSGSGPRFPGREELINEGPFPLRPEPRRRGAGGWGTQRTPSTRNCTTKKLQASPKPRISPLLSPHGTKESRPLWERRLCGSFFNTFAV